MVLHSWTTIFTAALSIRTHEASLRRCRLLGGPCQSPVLCPRHFAWACERRWAWLRFVPREEAISCRMKSERISRPLFGSGALLPIILEWVLVHCRYTWSRCLELLVPDNSLSLACPRKSRGHGLGAWRSLGQVKKYDVPFCFLRHFNAFSV